MNPETIILATVGLLLIVLVAIPFLNSSLVSYSTSATYTEQLLLLNNTPAPAAHYIDSVSSLYNLSAYVEVNATTDPGSATFTLTAIPATTSTLTMIGGAIGNVAVNGHLVGTLNGSGGPYYFPVPATDLLIGTNTVVFG